MESSNIQVKPTDLGLYLSVYELYGNEMYCLKFPALSFTLLLGLSFQSSQSTYAVCNLTVYELSSDIYLSRRWARQMYSIVCCFVIWYGPVLIYCYKHAPWALFLV